MAAKASQQSQLFLAFDDESDPNKVLISFASAELVPTGNYANVTVGPATATKFVRAETKEDLAKAISELAEPVEWALGHRRDQILKELQGE